MFVVWRIPAWARVCVQAKRNLTRVLSELQADFEDIEPVLDDLTGAPHALGS